MIAQYRENYNKSVTSYNRYVKKFPARIFLIGQDIRFWSLKD